MGWFRKEPPLKRKYGVVSQRGSNRKGGQNAKGGQIAKMGSNRKESIEREERKQIALNGAFNKEVFYSVCRDRGYPTLDAIVRFVGRKLKMTPKGAYNAIMEDNRLTWANILLLGHYLEMTPKEFCGCFLSGYFVEDELGHYKAHIDLPE